MGCIHVLQGFNMRFRDQKQMYRGPGIDVMEGDEIIILEDLLGGDLALDDFAENAVHIG